MPAGWDRATCRSEPAIHGRRVFHAALLHTCRSVTKKILVVDDDTSIRHMVRSVLVREGFRVMEADSGKAAIARMQEGDYDAVVLDLVMPDGGGDEVLETVAAQRPDVKCVVVISAAAPAVLEDLEVANVIVTLRKPFDIHELVTAIRECAAE